MDETNSSEVADRLRDELLSWPDVEKVHGPLAHRDDQFFMRFEFTSGQSYAIELTKDSDE